MLTREDLLEVKGLINDFKPDLGFFEKEMLIPQAHDRLEYIKSIFDEFRSIAQDKSVATHMDEALRLVVNPMAVNLNVPAPKVGEQYLKKVSDMLRTDYIEPISALKEKYRIEALKQGDIALLSSFLNEAKQLFDSIVAVREKMFLYSMRTFVVIKNLQTGKVEVGPPKELSLILLPFDTRLGELTNVASTTSESIKIWSEKLKEQQQKHVDMLTHLAEIKVAKEQTNATKKNITFQVAVIAFTVLLVIASQPINTYVEKQVAEHAFSKKSEEEAVCQSERLSFQERSQKEIRSIKEELATCAKTDGTKQ